MQGAAARMRGSLIGVGCRAMSAERPLPASGTRLVLAVWLAATALGLAQAALEYQPHTWIERDGRFYTNVNVTLAERGSLVQDEFCGSWYEGQLGWNRNLDAAWSNVALGPDGEHLPKHPILMPILSTPIFWAFGLHGTLIFNLLMFGVAGGAAFAFARRFGTRAGAVVAALGLLLATSVREYAYDYHVDVLILALFSLALALALARRGWVAGLLVGAAVMLRPTVLLWLPALVLVLVERRDWTTLKRALATGTAMMVVIALTNWLIYGAPWWSGYNRVLIVVDGVPRIMDVGGAFATPLAEGLRNLFGGPWGVSHRLTFVAFALPGLIVLARRRPLTALAAVYSLVASVILFAKYIWYGDRFLWPTAVLLLPAIALSFDLLGALLRRLPGFRLPMVAALGAAAVLLARFGAQAALQRGVGEDAGRALLNVALCAALAFGLTRAAERAVRGPVALIAPLCLVLSPGVSERLLAGGADLYFAAALALALGARHRIASGVLAALAGASFLLAEPGGLPIEPLVEPTSRPVYGSLVLAALGLPLLGRRAWLLLPLGLLLVPSIAELGRGRWPLFALGLLCLPLPALFDRAGGAILALWRRATPRAQLGVVAVALGALLLIGVARRLDEGPFRIASYRGVRTADVRLGHVPCDFLAWEHMNWECATFDRGVHNECGLATSQPLHVGGDEAGMFLVTTARGMERTVTWEGIEATGTFTLGWAIPEELPARGSLTVELDGEAVAEIELSEEAKGARHRRTIDTASLAGREVTVTLRLRGPGAAVLVDGGFTP